MDKQKSTAIGIEVANDEPYFQKKIEPLLSPSQEV